MLGNVDNLIQDVSKIRRLIQHLSNKYISRSNVRPNRGNEKCAQAPSLTQNNEKKRQDENETQQQGAELQQNLLSNESTATQASEESSAPEINSTSQVQLFLVRWSNFLSMDLRRYGNYSAIVDHSASIKPTMVHTYQPMPEMNHSAYIKLTIA